jgi:cytochrome P450
MPAPSFLDPAVLACPFPFYEQLHQHAPVIEVPELGVVLVTRYDDVMTVIKDDETFLSGISGELVSAFSFNPQRDAVNEVLARAPVPAAPLGTLGFADPPDHTRQRGIVNQAFTPRRVRLLTSVTEKHAAELLELWPESGEIEFVSQYAAPLPIAVLSEALGVKIADREHFRIWTESVLVRLGQVLTEEEDLAAARQVVEFQNYMVSLIEDRRHGDHDDMLGDLLRARLEDEAEATMTELIGIVLHLLVAGNETTRGAIASMMYELVKQPDLLAAVRADRSLVPKAFEETLRLQAPVMLFTRVASRDVDIAGVPIKEGRIVMPVFHAANCDASYFPEPAQFKLDRRYSKPHLGFGHGIHFCAGANLARAETVIAFNEILDRFRTIELADGEEPQFNANFWSRSLAGLRLKVAR